MQTSLPSTHAGTTIGPYRIIDRIAVGGMAEIFLGRLEGPAGFQKAVVLKRLLPQLASDKVFSAMLQDEARLAARLNHPNVVQIYDFGIDDGGSFYIAMEYLIGEDLAALIMAFRDRGEPVPTATILRIIAQAAEGLHFAHQCKDADGQPLGIVHRDISPQNIVVTVHGYVKVVDFGIAKAATQVVKTEAGELKGKLLYMPPEQLKGQRLDHRADVFALGVTLFEALCGTTPADTEVQILAVQGEQLPKKRLSDLRPDVDPRVVAIVEKATAENPQDRFQSADAMQRAIEAYLQQLGEPPNAAALAATMTDVFGAQYFDAQARRQYSQPSLGPASDTVDARDADDKTVPDNVGDPVAPLPGDQEISLGSPGRGRNMTAVIVASAAVSLTLFGAVMAATALGPLAGHRGSVEPSDALTIDDPVPQSKARSETKTKETTPVKTLQAVDPLPPPRKTKRANKATKASDKPTYEEVVSLRNRVRASMNSLGLLPGDVPAFDRDIARIDAQIRRRNYDHALGGLAALLDRVDAFELGAGLVKRKLERAKRLDAGGEKIAAVESLAKAGRWVEANTRLNQILARGDL